MDRLWTPWRYAYISGEGPQRAKGVPEALNAWLDADPDQSRSKDPRCVFCNMIAAVDYAVEHGMATCDAERAALIVHRGSRTFLCLNRYPYSNGHVLIVPYDHTDSLARLPTETAHELIACAQNVDTTLRTVYRPDGLNFGLNLGEAAGAGVAGHLHMHALPRWSGDTNFMTVTAETRILPETLETTWQKLRGLFTT
jgi:ATP adenylyltransferase